MHCFQPLRQGFTILTSVDINTWNLSQSQANWEPLTKVNAFKTVILQ